MIVKPSTSDTNPHTYIRGCLEIILTRAAMNKLPISYEGVFSACRSIVMVANGGEGLYGTVKMELEKSVNRLAKDLTEFKPEERMNWITEFVDASQWFEKQVVSWTVIKSQNNP